MQEDKRKKIPEDESGANKRKYFRLDKSIIVSYSLKGDPFKRYDLSQTRNISYGGILFTTSKYFEKGVVLNMIIKFPFLRERINVEGEVVYCGLKKGNIYETGVSFLNLDQKVINEFKEYQIRLKKIREADKIMENLSYKKDDDK